MPTVDEPKKKTTGLKAVLVDRIARLASCAADRMRAAGAPKAKKPDYGQMYADWQECERKRRELEATLEFKTTNFYFAAREFSNGVRKCVLKTYNAGIPKSKQVGPVAFARNLPPLDTARLEWAFGEIGVPYGLLRFVSRSIVIGDSIAHEFNTKNYTKVDQLLEDLPDVRVPESDKDSFRRLAGFWKNGICEMVDAGSWKQKQIEMSGTTEVHAAVSAIRAIVSGDDVRFDDSTDPATFERVEFGDFAIGPGRLDVDVFDACAFHRIDLLPGLYARGMRPRLETQTDSNPFADALFDRDFAKADVLFSCGYSLFRKQGYAIYTWGDPRYERGEGDYGDIFDALLFGGNLAGLAAAIFRYSTPEQLERRDEERYCLFKTNELLEPIFKAHAVVVSAVEIRRSEIT